MEIGMGGGWKWQGKGGLVMERGSGGTGIEEKGRDEVKTGLDGIDV